MHSRIVVTVAGHSGAGKSTLAAGLSRLFACPAFEVGPLYRYVAWLTVCRKAGSLHAAAAALDRLIARQILHCAIDEPGVLAANRIYHGGHALDDELWDPRLTPTVLAAAHDSYVQSRVRLAAESLLGSPTAVVVVARQPLLPALGAIQVPLVLVADSEVRFERKAAQLGKGHPDVEVAADPGMALRNTTSGFELNSASESPERVSAVAATTVTTSIQLSGRSRFPAPDTAVPRLPQAWRAYEQSPPGNS